MQINIRRATEYDSKVLTAISFESKGYWNYPEEYFDVWKDELTITQEYIEKNIVYVAEIDHEVIGYYCIVYNPQDYFTKNISVMKGFWLEHIFILSEYINKKVGSKLIEHAKEVCKEIKCEKLYIFSDPNSKGFYLRMGANYLYESPSSIEDRTVSVFELYS